MILGVLPLLLSFIVGAIVAATYFLRRQSVLTQKNMELMAKLEAQATSKDDVTQLFEALSARALKENNKQFLELAEENLKRFQEKAEGDLEKRQKAIETVLKPVEKSLEKMDEKIQNLEKERKGAYEAMKKHIETMAEDQARLRSETSSLVQALREPTRRGQWGELQLKRVLDMAGMVEGVDYETQVSTKDGMRPDVIVKLPAGQSLVIDSKAPMDAYLNAMQDDISVDQRASYLKQHAKNVKDHIKTLGSKGYTEAFDTPEFVVMFLPDESFFRAALDQDPTLINYGVTERVIPASPTNLIALLRAVVYGWRQEKLAESAREISEIGVDLYKRIQAFGGHMEKIGNSLGSAVKHFNSAVGSLERNVLSGARKFKELKIVAKDETEADPDVIETNIRQLTSEEFVEDEQDKVSSN